MQCCDPLVLAVWPRGAQVAALRARAACSSVVLGAVVCPSAVQSLLEGCVWRALVPPPWSPDTCGSASCVQEGGTAELLLVSLALPAWVRVRGPGLQEEGSVCSDSRGTSLPSEPFPASLLFQNFILACREHSLVSGWLVCRCPPLRWVPRFPVLPGLLLGRWWGTDASHQAWGRSHAQVSVLSKPLMEGLLVPAGVSTVQRKDGEPPQRPGTSRLTVLRWD